MKLVEVLLASILASAPLASPPPVPRDVDLKASDGVLLKSTFYPAAKPGPAILLLHQCNRDRKTWTTLATTLADRGFHVLTLDYRGYGESGGDRFLDLPPEKRAAEQAKWSGDIDVALAYLRAQPGVEKNRIGAAGASCGVNQSIQLALRHPDVVSLALLSGASDEPGRQYLRRSAWLPIFAAASDDDGEAVPVLRWIQGFSRNPGNRFVEYKAAGHGTEMFAVEKGLQPLLVEWFDRTLRGSRAAASDGSATAAKPSAFEEFWTVLTAPGGATRARQLFAEAKKRDPNVFLFPEFAVNLLGYERLQGGAAQEAIEIFQLNVDAYPNSANVYDSLADAYVAAAQPEPAIQYSEKALEILRANPPADADRAKAIRQSAEQKLRQLRGNGKPNPPN
jgi:dienelactone hydrolase